MREGDSFFAKLLEKANFIVKMTGPAGQFWVLESILSVQNLSSLIFWTVLKPELCDTRSI